LTRQSPNPLRDTGGISEADRSPLLVALTGHCGCTPALPNAAEFVELLATPAVWHSHANFRSHCEE